MMASISGQPSPKPQSLPKTPSAPKEDLFAPPSPDEMAMFAPPTAEEMGAPQEEAFADTLGGQIVGKAAEFLPMAGSIVGGIAGGITGIPAAGVGAVPGSIAGAALGGAAGTAYRDIIETQILGRKMKSGGEVAMDIAKSAVVEGASQAIGGAVMKGLGKVGSAVLQYGDEAIKSLKGAVTVAREGVEEPLTKMIAQKATALTPRESGDAVKNLLVNNIKGKYAPFVKAYAELDEVGKVVPLKDESRRSLTMKIREWSASELGGDNARAVAKFADDLDAADNGAKLRDVISQIGDARSNAYQNGATKLAKTLKGLQDRANDFMENETTKLATRIAKGTGSMEEMAAFERMMAAQGNPNVSVDPANLAKYTKSVANDYLKSLNTVKKDYAGFRGFLEEVGEQTKLKTSSKGPMSFLDDIDGVPSEKLMDRMFDPKNVRALETMKKETPEIFDEVAKARVKNLLEKSSPTGELDLGAFQKQVMKLPPDTRNLLFSPQEVATLNKISLSPKLKSLTNLEKKLDNKLMGYMQEIGTIIGEKTPQAIKAPIRQSIGAVPARAAVGTAEALMPQGEQSLPRTVNGLGQ